MFTVKTKINEQDVELEIKTKKTALDIKAQLINAGHETKVIQVREVE